MNTDSHNQLASMVHMQTGVQAIHGIAVPDPETAALSELADDAALMLRMLSRNGQELSDALEARLDCLQESFMEILNNQMAADTLKGETRLHLYLSPEGRLVVEGEDGDAEKLCELIAGAPVLQRRFQELARLALLSRGVEVARQAHEALKSPESSPENPLFGRYHMCLKGSLSHFYVR
ncbi:hypothetical protein [Desulfovibrio sp. ZJ369]|uniref:hypothetical protein n=1 Tax=Desulfovibrio sp. ZJ369 TaxID=2709793 RepID=UPI0013EBE95F|nr:hypothetical protein [Desulfovibrio sp. ZJ369]